MTLIFQATMVCEVIPEDRCCSTPANTPAPDSGYDEMPFLPHMTMYSDGRVEWGFMDAPEAVPRNYYDIIDDLAIDRPSVTPELVTRDEFQAFCKATTIARQPDDVVQDVIRPFLEVTWNARDVDGHCAFDAMAPLSRGMPVVRPAMFHGEPRSALDPGALANLQGLLVPSDPADRTVPIAPNFILVVPDDDSAKAGKAALSEIGRCAALSARAMHALATYARGPPRYSGEAESVVACFFDGLLTMWVSHVQRPAGDRTEPTFHLTPVVWADMCANLNEHLYALTVYRNLRDWASQKRREAFDRVNGLEA